MNGSVTLEMNASAAAIWNLVSDVTRVGSFSPETFEAEWLDGANGPVTGARFRGHVKRNGKGPTYWTTCTVVECVPERTFGFQVEFNGRPANVWRYEIQPHEGHSSVTESFQLAPNLANRIYWSLLGWARGRTNREGMRTTLERIKTEVERTGTGD